jgi:hypothetical protein
VQPILKLPGISIQTWVLLKPSSRLIFQFLNMNKLLFICRKPYVKDWIDNTMIFLEVNDVKQFWDHLLKLDLTARYSNIRLIPIKEHHWGSECFIHDPSGILWHIGEFNR